MKRLISLLIFMLCLSLSSAGFAFADTAASSIDNDAAVTAKVAELAAACSASGAETEYEIALWMHDWLIHNAEYDESLQEHGADGVLLKGTGVCESYTRAYTALLTAMGVNSKEIISDAMDHSWNIVRMDGNWYHVDCTWDDPIDGEENHAYFGLSDALMARDHVWDALAGYACTSNDYNYYLRTGEAISVLSQEELNSIIHEQLMAGNTEITLYNTSTDGFELFDAVEYWFENESWRYTFTSYSASGSDYCLTITFEGYDPSTQSFAYSDDASLESALISALCGRCETIFIYDHVSNPFSAEALYLKIRSIVDKYAAVYKCTLSNSYGVGVDEPFIVVYLSYEALPENILILPKDLNAVGAAAFMGNVRIEEVRFSGALCSSIGSAAFKGCTSLQKITIPGSVTSIAEDAFDNCPNLKIFCSANSKAHEYAVTHSIDFEFVD